MNLGGYDIQFVGFYFGEVENVVNEIEQVFAALANHVNTFFGDGEELRILFDNLNVA